MADFQSDLHESSPSNITVETWTGFDGDDDCDVLSSSSITHSTPRMTPVLIVLDKPKARSSIWTTFKVYQNKELDNYAHCTICNQKVLYTSHHSTGMLDKHFRMKHRELYDQHLDDLAAKKLKASGASVNVSTSKQSKITGFMMCCDKFPHAYLKWVVMTYQPNNACENPSFQEMCLTMKGKAPVLGRDKVQKWLSEECATMKVEMRHILSG
jgi:hypothetical protein